MFRLFSQRHSVYWVERLIFNVVVRLFGKLQDKKVRFFKQNREKNVLNVEHQIYIFEICIFIRNLYFYF